MLLAAIAVVILLATGCSERREEVYDSGSGHTLSCVVEPAGSRVRLTKCYRVD